MRPLSRICPARAGHLNKASTDSVQACDLAGEEKPLPAPDAESVPARVRPVQIKYQVPVVSLDSLMAAAHLDVKSGVAADAKINQETVAGRRVVDAQDHHRRQMISGLSGVELDVIRVVDIDEVEVCRRAIKGDELRLTWRGHLPGRERGVRRRRLTFVELLPARGAQLLRRRPAAQDILDGGEVNFRGCRRPARPAEPDDTGEAVSRSLVCE